MNTSNSYTKGAPFLITLVQDEGEFSRNIHYLLPDGTRRRVTIDVSHDSDEQRDKIGKALSTGGYKRGRTQ